MSSWDTNPWSNFCDPHWKLICHNKWHPGTSEISTPPDICTKPTQVFLPTDGEASWSLLPSSVSLLSGGTVQPENTYPCILKVTGQIWENQERIRINTNHNYHQRSSVLASLKWSDNKVRSSFNQPNRKKWGGRLVSVVKHLTPKVFLLWHYH